MKRCDETLLPGMTPVRLQPVVRRRSSELLKRAMAEVRLQFRAIELLLKARIITSAQIGKARRIARKQLSKTPPNAEVSASGDENQKPL